ncbi:MAG: DNA mismatch repair protein MutS [Geminicoccaceae bacterium]
MAASQDGGTPMIRQYKAIKAAHPDMLLFYRMGDFYELFFEDAVEAAAALDIALTKRGRHDGQDIAMCGVPVHSAESYLQKLIKQGFRVAVCEQTEDPAEAKKRPGAGKLVAREVVRIVTPGTLTEDGLLDPRNANYLASLAEAREQLGLAWLDLSTGEFRTETLGPAQLQSELARIDPRELLVAESTLERADGRDRLGSWFDRATPVADQQLRSGDGEKRLRSLFGIATLEAFGDFSRAELAAAGGLLAYVELTQKAAVPRLSPPVRMERGGHLALDPATRASLELTRNLQGERQGSLLAAVDRTLTGAGGRRLAAWLSSPLTDRAAINERLDRIQALIETSEWLAGIRASLKGCPDVERALSRLALDRGGPRDLAAVREALRRASDLASGQPPPAAALVPLVRPLEGFGPLAGQLDTALVDEPPVLCRDGGFITEGFDRELDDARSLRDRGRKHIAALEAKLRSETGIASLKIRHNHMLGYYIEVTANHRDKTPETFVQRQSMANAIRFTTAELSELEMALVQAQDRACTRELALFDELVGAVTASAEALANLADALAQLDVAQGLATLAMELRWCRPELTDGLIFEIEGGRHPVVEQALSKAHQGFIANDAVLDDTNRLWLLTGPNMAGKSTFLRQNALIVVLAQMGAYVPARRAKIGLVDKLFSRVGAADDLARGQSTFMVEMVETASILNQATSRSLVILDEIGRGTATHDGLSIAWAVVEHLHDVIRCRGLFATHFHELTALAERLEHLACHTMAVREWQNEVVFLHEVAAGTADRSYGIHVAKLAGLPPVVVARADQLLAGLEKGMPATNGASILSELPLFESLAEPTPPPPAMPPSPVVDALEKLEVDDLSPRQALNTLYELKRLATAQTERSS